MIENFEEQTHDLTEDEIKMVPIMVKALRKRIGRENCVTSKEIISGMAAAGHKIDGPRVRKIINFIRVNKLVVNLIATSTGYYIASDPEEVESYKRSLDGRIAALQQLRNSYD